MSKVAVVTGVTGQDGSYMVEHLLETNEYEKVVGIVRRSAQPNLKNIMGALKDDRFCLHEAELSDPTSIMETLKKYNSVNEIYNFAAQSHVGTSFSQPHYTFQVNTIGLLNILESVRSLKLNCKILQASTSEMWGVNWEVIDGKPGQGLSTPFRPSSPYGVSKLAAHHLCDIYARSYNMHIKTVISHNHESPRRGENFVTRKITKWLGRFVEWLNNNAGGDPESVEEKGDFIVASNGSKFRKLVLGNLNACRDWGYAKDYVKIYRRILLEGKEFSYVVSTGETHSVEEFLNEAFNVVGLGDYVDLFVVVSQDMYRPCEVPYLRGDASKTFKEFGWQPETSFSDLVRIMVESDVKSAVYST